MNANKFVFGVNLGHMWHEIDMVTGWMEILLNGVADGWVRPHALVCLFHFNFLMQKG
jgi:hypothetical protein